ncbi:hypothetical protein [Subtercola frigoramans]|uniref:ABC-type uncharacterized transport system permease subunit n=1 Tax=Subtercola frigoramans TaxID=120298 RepID=A0ABS2L0E7_9MICO|nr:hypothetical protein [Subtercola frigoramans]MBM7470548.1 ABC-type uncharacterized transport system permease subunit [Subtercola frigoramans]
MTGITLRAAAYVASIDNPLNGILPDFSIFGVQFTELWQKLVAGIWAIAIVIAVIYLIMGVGSMASASGVNANPMAHAEGRKKATNAAIALGILAALAVIVGAILAVVS